MRAWRTSWSIVGLLAAALVWLQASAFAHAAEHGFEEHDHDGVECVVELACGAFERLDPPAGVLEPHPSAPPARILIGLPVTDAGAARRCAKQPRAPPASA